MKKPQDPPTSIRLPKETRAMLDEMAAEDVRTLSNFIDYLIRQTYSERQRKKSIDSQL